jgi:hypothetical protein
MLICAHNRDDTILTASPNSFGLNHYGTYWCTGGINPVKGARADQLLRGTVDHTRYRDGEPIGLEGHQGQAWNGESTEVEAISAGSR